MATTSTCKAVMCNTTIAGDPVACPACGGKMMRSAAIRRMGAALTICGGAIVGIIGFAAITFVPLMLHPGSGGATQFNGTREEAQMFVGVICVVLLFGIAALINGIFQLSTGRRSRPAQIVGIGLAMVLAGGAYVLVRFT